MKKVIRLTESDLARIVRRVINEAPTESKFAKVVIDVSPKVTGIFAPGEVTNGRTVFYNCDQFNIGRLLSARIKVTPEGQRLGLTADNLKITLPVEAPPLGVGGKGERIVPYGGVPTQGMQGSYQWSFTTPKTKYTNNTGKPVPLFTIDFSTNDQKTPTQKAVFYANVNTQFGNPAAKAN